MVSPIKLVDAYYNPIRGASQPDVDRAYIIIERNGFAVDTDYLNRQAAQARLDEAAKLQRLFELFQEAVPEGDTYSHDRNDVDGIWSSAVQLTKLVHGYLGLEKSPIWKKGEVRYGETKLDGVALEYLAAANPAFRPLLSGVVDLRRTRGCLKYLSKLPRYVDATDGLIHPVYGADSDDSDSTGTNSGRNVMKNPEGQQIPNSKEKDPYAIRKGFITPNPETDILVVRDYSAMEAVVLHSICVAFFDDYSLAGCNDPNIDFHGENARQVFGRILRWTHPVSGKYLDEYPLSAYQTDPYLKDRRRDAKTVFYGLQFCKGIRGFAYTLLDTNGQPVGEAIARRVVEGFLSVLTGIKKFQDWVGDYLWSFRDRGDFYPGIGSFTGRWRNVSDLVLDSFRTGNVDWKYRKAVRQLTNHAGGQSPGADIKTTAVVALVNRQLKGECPGKTQMDIHDELHVRCLESEADEVSFHMEDCMENTYELPGGIKLRTAGAKGKNWYVAK